MWLGLLGGILAVLLLIGGAATYVHFIANGPAGQIATSSKINHGQPRSTPTQKLGDQLPAAQIPVGKLLYGTNLPACDLQGNLWNKTANAYLTCGASSTQFVDTSTAYIAGTFLDKLPNGYGIPNDYVLQVQVNERSTSRGAFGVFFRNQPGLTHPVVFYFLLYAYGLWEASVYNDITGKKTALHQYTTTIRREGSTTIDNLTHVNTCLF